ncbi:MAG: hypothetical protein ABI675_21655 [Chitinophagaceae bacterium]
MIKLYCTNTETLIDSRNKAIWDEVTTKYDLSIQLYNGREYRHQLFQGKAVILVPELNNSIELFTHELLHIYIRTKRLFITEYLLQRLKAEPLLYWSLTDNLFEQVGHYLEHLHILPIYLTCGFDRSNFFEDYELQPCSSLNIQLLYRGMKKTPPSMAIIDLYINKFFAMKASLNASSNYNGYLEDLKEMNPALFSILDRFWKRWTGIDINSLHTTGSPYKKFTAEFVHELGNWTVKNIYASKRIA